MTVQITNPLMVLREHIVITDTKILELLQKYDTEHTYTVTQEEFSTALQVHVRHGAHVHRHTGRVLYSPAGTHA